MKVKIGYDVYDIILEDEPLDDKNKVVDGYFSQQDNTINITTAVGVRRQKQILIHEILHGISDMVFDLHLTEKQVENLSVGLLMLIWDNKELIDLIQKETKPLE